MRWTTLGWAMAMLLAAGTASAAGGTGGRGDTGNKGGNKPSTTSSEPTQAETDDTDVKTRTSSRAQVNPDVIQKQEEVKRWSVGAAWETHRFIRQEDAGTGSSKVYNQLYFNAGYELTDRDRIGAGWGFSQKYIADPGETGFRGTDISLQYTRLVPLPERFNLRITPAVTIPISYGSIRASNITSPSLTFTLARRFGDLSLYASLSGGTWIDRYTTSAGDDGFGGAPNPHWRLNGSLTGEYSMPFHRPLSIGASITDAYLWLYEVGNSGCRTEIVCQQGAVQPPDAQFGNQQPMMQSYGGEIFARYILPDIMGMYSDVVVALSDGPGSNQVLHDGVVHPYLFYRGTSEVYGALTLRY